MNPLIETFRERRCFVLAKLVPRADGKVDKIPCNFDGIPINAQDEANWLNGQDAADYATAFGLGVGIVISEGSGLACVDIDHAWDGAAWAPHVETIIAQFPGAYVEVSQSGTGLHVIFSCMPVPAHKTRCAAPVIECYTRARFIYLTGTHARGDVRTDLTMQLVQFIAQYFGAAEASSDTEWTDAPRDGSLPIADDELVRRMLNSAGGAGVAVGDKVHIRDLLKGNADALGRAWPSSRGDAFDRSSADLSLASKLAWWTRGNCEQIERIMRSSDLMREKYDRNDGKYLRDTILKACADHRGEYYKGRQSDVSRVTEAPVPAGTIPAPPGAPVMLNENMRALNPVVCAEVLAATPDTLFLPNDHLPDIVAAERIFRHLGGTRELFRRGDAVVEFNEGGHLAVITPTMLQSRLNDRGRKVRSFSVNDKTKELFHHAKRCSESAAKTMLAARSVYVLPEIKLVTRLPVLLERGGNLILTEPGYNADCGVFVTSDMTVPTVPLDEAASKLAALLRDFQFAEGGDRARALASIVAPALRMAQLVKGDALIASIEADKSQTGKGYLLKLYRALYGENAPLLTQREGGVGSFDESLGQALLDGSPFISFDNLRGVLNSQFLEAVVTAGDDPVMVRVPFRAAVPVDVRLVSLQLTSNGVQGTVDLSNRLLLIRLRKQRKGYAFMPYPEGDLLSHIAARVGYYLGCIHAVVRHWYSQGRQALPSEHSFRHWVGALDWIVQNVWQTKPLLDGHDSALSRIADPALSWLRKVALLVIQAGKGGQELPLAAIRELCRDHDEMPPNIKPDALDPVVDMMLGRVLARCFAEAATLTVDGMTITCVERQERDEWRHMVPARFYVFKPAG